MKPATRATKKFKNILNKAKNTNKTTLATLLQISRNASQ